MMDSAKDKCGGCKHPWHGYLKCPECECMNYRRIAVMAILILAFWSANAEVKLPQACPFQTADGNCCLPNSPACQCVSDICQVDPE